MLELSTDMIESIRAQFPETKWSDAENLLRSHEVFERVTAPDRSQLAERIRYAVLKLSGGDLNVLSQQLDKAKIDWRGTLVAAGLGDEGAALNWLTLSGGGFRATLFHLGVLLTLLKSRRVNDDTRIVGVSGGAILAANLGLHWKQHLDLFRDCGSSTQPADCITRMMQLVRADVRNRVLRRWLLFWGHMLCLAAAIGLLLLAYCDVSPWSLVRGWLLVGTAALGTWTVLLICIGALRSQLTGLLESQYSRWLLGKTAVLDSLRQDVYVTSTSLSTGRLVTFSHSKIRHLCYDGTSEEDNEPKFRLARAAAASSAFPPLFPPLSLPLVGPKMRNPDRLTDGGVFDNLGVWLVRHLASEKVGERAPPGSQPFSTILVSDASRPLKYATQASFQWALGRNIRASDLLMSRLADSDLRMPTDPSTWPIECRIWHDSHRHAELGDYWQEQVSQIRTDLDGFTDPEIYMLVLHGAATAANALGLPIDQRLTSCEILQACGLKGTSESLKKQFENSQPNSNDSWPKRHWRPISKATKQVRQLFLGRDRICWAWSMPLTLLLLVVYGLIWEYHSVLPMSLEWRNVDLTRPPEAWDQRTLAALARDIKPPVSGETLELRDAPVVATFPLTELCRLRRPASFVVTIPNFVIDTGSGADVSEPQVYHAVSVRGTAAFQRLLGEHLPSGGIAYRVENPHRQDRLLLMVHLPGHEPHELAQKLEKEAVISWEVPSK